MKKYKIREPYLGEQYDQAIQKEITRQMNALEKLNSETSKVREEFKMAESNIRNGLIQNVINYEKYVTEIRILLNHQPFNWMMETKDRLKEIVDGTIKIRVIKPVPDYKEPEKEIEFPKSKLINNRVHVMDDLGKWVKYNPPENYDWGSFQSRVRNKKPPPMWRFLQKPAAGEKIFSTPNIKAKNKQ